MPPADAENVPVDVAGAKNGGWSSRLGDALVISALLAAGNWLAARNDPGFFTVNPTPWILLPLALGARHGLASGLVGAAAATGLVFAGFHFFLGQSDFGALVSDRAYYFLSLLSAGALGGLLHSLLVLPAERHRRDAGRMSASCKALQDQLDLAQASEAELARRLLLHDASLISLQDRARQLFDLAEPAEAVEIRLLRLLEELFDVGDAAIYQRSGEFTHRWTRCGASGDPTLHPESVSFDEDDTSVAAAALKHRDLATCASLWQERSPSTSSREASPSSSHRPDPLAAVPWSRAVNEAPSRLLIIHHLPLAQATWQNLSRIEALFAWTMSIDSRIPNPAATSAPHSHPRQGGDVPRILPPEEFSLHIDRAVACATSLPLEFRLLLFEPNERAGTPAQQAFVQSVLHHQRRGDSVGGVLLSGDSGSPESYAIGVLVPCNHHEDAKNRAAEILRAVPQSQGAFEQSILVIDRDDDRFNRQWNEIVKPRTRTEAA